MGDVSVYRPGRCVLTAGSTPINREMSTVVLSRAVDCERVHSPIYLHFYLVALFDRVQCLFFRLHRRNPTPRVPRPHRTVLGIRRSYQIVLPHTARRAGGRGCDLLVRYRSYFRFDSAHVLWQPPSRLCVTRFITVRFDGLLWLASSTGCPSLHPDGINASLHPSPFPPPTLSPQCHSPETVTIE